MKIKLFILIGVLLMALSGCGAGAQAVSNAKVTDFVTNYEPRNSGYMIFWVQTDTTSAYCTNNADIIDLGNYLRETHQLATITYSSINNGDGDGYNILGGGCDRERKGIQMYRLVAICQAGYGDKLPCVPTSAKPSPSKYALAQ
jgi:hypothetical protein